MTAEHRLSYPSSYGPQLYRPVLRNIRPPWELEFTSRTDREPRAFTLVARLSTRRAYFVNGRDQGIQLLPEPIRPLFLQRELDGAGNGEAVVESQVGGGTLQGMRQFPGLAVVATGQCGLESLDLFIRE